MSVSCQRLLRFFFPSKPPKSVSHEIKLTQIYADSTFYKRYAQKNEMPKQLLLCFISLGPYLGLEGWGGDQGLIPQPPYQFEHWCQHNWYNRHKTWGVAVCRGAEHFRYSIDFTARLSFTIIMGPGRRWIPGFQNAWPTYCHRSRNGFSTKRHHPFVPRLHICSTCHSWPQQSHVNRKLASSPLLPKLSSQLSVVTTDQSQSVLFSPAC